MTVLCSICGQPRGFECLGPPPHVREEQPPTNALERATVALESLAEHFAAKDRAYERARAESWERMQAAPIEIEQESKKCLYCAAHARRVLRGPRIFGCTVCVGEALERAFIVL